MDRRTFLRWTAAAGVAVTTSPSWVTSARAATEPYGGPFYLFIHCAGGWDPTLLCDPKGRTSEDAPDPVNTYDRGDIGEEGPFTYAPIEGNAEFFQRFRDQLLVINGLDNQTNSHETGTRYTWSGNMDPGSPALSALLAANADPRPSLSYLSNGGYDITAGLVAATRLGDTSTIRRLAFPDRLDEDEADSSLFTDSTRARLQAARSARLERQHTSSSLPRVRQAMTLLQGARAGDNELAALAEVLPATPDSSDNPLRKQAQVAMACFRAGVTVSANMSMSGFDTHGDHDASHTPNMQDVVDGITFAMDEAERQGVADQVVIVVGSDFARTPWYNDTDGKDHWSITSMLMMGPGIQGGRVIGATDEQQVPLPLDPTTLRPAEDGIRITPADVHASLRKLTGLNTWDVANRFPVGTPLPLFG
jgi:hypothetical protein